MIRSIIRLYEQGNVSVFGNCGSGKDLLQANVIARRKKPYVSNVDYGGEWYPLDFQNLDVGSNYEDFINGTVKPYTYPYPLGADVYLSDAGIYLPSQYCNDLNKKYPRLATFVAIRRHIARSNFHVNSQHLGRVYDKIREQGDTYVLARWSIILFGKIVIQRVTLYDRYNTAEMRVKPCRVHKPLLGNKETRMQAEIALDNFANTHGEVRDKLLVYVNRSKYDTHHFYKLLKGDAQKLEEYNKTRSLRYRLRNLFARRSCDTFAR